ncbi:hypothetical protein LCGC14_2530740 [marine sediment metagenome]|uniref:Polymerase beta nucleotidyltransferase domain-containing protein n=1 Tax=marine sediment metagenome TaxID=412755 RepID=A0A0F9BGH3_9ZZZZ
MTKEQIKDKISKALSIAPHRGQIKSLAIFGSYIKGQVDESSDIDLLVEFLPDAHIGLFEFVGIKEHFSSELGIKVDLVTPAALSKYFREEVFRQAEPIYEK